jgi:hypothetical protein
LPKRMLSKRHPSPADSPYVGVMISGPINARRCGRLCRTDHMTCKPMRSAVVTYFGSEQPQIILQTSRR